MTCLMRAYVLREAMLCRGDFLWNILYCWRACLQNGIFKNMLCFTGRHVLLKDMFFMWIFIVRGHFFQFKMSHVLLEGMPYWKPYIT